MMMGKSGNDLEICCYTYQQEGEKKRGQVRKDCQSRKGNDLPPPDASASTALAGAVGKAR